MIENEYNKSKFKKLNTDIDFNEVNGANLNYTKHPKSANFIFN